MKKILLILLVFVFGCKSTDKKSPKISIGIGEVKENVDLSKIIEIKQEIFIKHSVFERFGDVKKAFLLNDFIYLHTEFPNTITKLTKEGQVINQFIPDFQITEITSIDFFDSLIYVLDRESMEVHLFDYEFKRKDQFKIPYFAQSLKVISADKIAFFLGNEIMENKGRLVIYNYKDKKPIADLLEISKNQKRYFNFLTNYHFLLIRNNLYFWNSPQNAIFKLSENGLLDIDYEIDYGKKSLPKDFYEKADYDNPFEFLQDVKAKEYAHRHFKMLANNDYLLFNFDYDSAFGTTIFNIENQTSTSFKNIFDDIWTNKPFEELMLSFFLELYGNNLFIGFLPYEFFEDSCPSDGEEPCDMLFIGKIKT